MSFGLLGQSSLDGQNANLVACEMIKREYIDQSTYNGGENVHGVFLRTLAWRYKSYERRGGYYESEGYTALPSPRKSKDDGGCAQSIAGQACMSQVNTTKCLSAIESVSNRD